MAPPSKVSIYLHHLVNYRDIQNSTSPPSPSLFNTLVHLQIETSIKFPRNISDVHCNKLNIVLIRRLQQEARRWGDMQWQPVNK